MKHYYKCWKCGQSLSKSYGVTCTEPFPARTSGICAGSCTIEISARVEEKESENTKSGFYTRTRTSSGIKDYKNGELISKL